MTPELANTLDRAARGAGISDFVVNEDGAFLMASVGDQRGTSLRIEPSDAFPLEALRLRLQLEAGAGR